MCVERRVGEEEKGRRGCGWVGRREEWVKWCGVGCVWVWWEGGGVEEGREGVEEVEVNGLGVGGYLEGG